MIRYAILLALFISVCFNTGFSQDKKYSEHLSSFLMTSFTYKASSKWTAYMELQARSIERFTPVDYYEIKGGGAYNINSNNQAFAGIGRYATYKEKSLTQEELRLWLQYTFSNKIDRIKLDHRVRAEQRFFHQTQLGTHSTDQRYRYRLNASVPINRDKIIARTFFVNAFNEVFLGPKDPPFKRNRLYTGLGYQFTKNVGTSTGYMWQRELSLSGNRSLHFLYLALNFVLDHKDLEKDRHIDVPVAD